jgi:hypothetical protein
LISSIGDLRSEIRRHDALSAKAAAYQRLGVRLTYHTGTNSVRAEANLDPDAVGIESVSKARHLPVTYAIPLMGQWDLLVP